MNDANGVSMGKKQRRQPGRAPGQTASRLLYRVLYHKDEAVCIIQTKKVYVVPFHAVTAEHAYKEGEGDKSLAFWRKVHEKFFTECLEEVNLKFTSDMKVVCEEFEVVYKR